MKKDPGKLEAFVYLVSLLLVVYPDLAQPRTWWWLAMRGSREGARRFGQLAILAEQRYRAEVAS